MRPFLKDGALKIVQRWAIVVAHPGVWRVRGVARLERRRSFRSG